MNMDDVQLFGLFAHERDAEGRPKLPDPFAGGTPSDRDLFVRYARLNGVTDRDTLTNLWAEERSRRAAARRRPPDQRG